MEIQKITKPRTKVLRVRLQPLSRPSEQLRTRQQEGGVSRRGMERDDGLDELRHDGLLGPAGITPS